MVVYFILGLLTGWTTFFFAFVIYAQKLDKDQKKIHQEMIQNMYDTYQDYLNIEDLRKYKS